MTKAPRDVVHDVAELEHYLDRMFVREGLTFDSWFAMFGQGFYRARNLAVLDLVRPLRPRRVLEFACAGGFLADLLLAGVPGIEHYTCSSVSRRMVDHTRLQLSHWPQCAVALVDADLSRSRDMAADEIASYDLFLTTSFEHIRLDRELIKEMPADSAFVFSVALFDDPEHFRVFRSEDELQSRYGDLIAIDRIVLLDDRTKAIVGGRVKGALAQERPRHA